MDIFEELSVPTVINAAGTLTRLGGTLMSPVAKEAMAAASEAAVPIDALQAGASRVLGELTGAEAGMVTSGCFAALAIGTAACVARLNVTIMNRLPAHAARNGCEVVISRHHRNSYDRAFELCGCTLVEVGYLDTYLGVGVREVEPEEIAAAITPRTVAVAYVAMEGMGPSLRVIADVAHDAGLPVIVDAANQVPPVRNLRKFIAEGADLVAMSGGKALRGPQSSGYLFGRRELVASALLQQLDMDTLPESWVPPDLIEKHKLKGVPRHGFGRGFKVGKEEIAGAMAALLDFTKNVEAYQEVWKDQCLLVAAELKGIAGLRAIFQSSTETGRVPLLFLEFDDPVSARETITNLRNGEPPIFLNERWLDRGQLIFNPVGLGTGQEQVVASRLQVAIGMS